MLELVDPTKGLRCNKYLDFLAHYFNLGEEKWNLYRAYKQKKNEAKEVDMVRTIFEQKRLEEGQQMLLLLLPQKLGPMPPEIESSIRTLTDLDRIHYIVTQFMKINNWQDPGQLMTRAN